MTNEELQARIETLEAAVAAKARTSRVEKLGLALGKAVKVVSLTATATAKGFVSGIKEGMK